VCVRCRRRGHGDRAGARCCESDSVEIPVRRFVFIVLTNLGIAAGLCVAAVGLFMLMSMVREMTGWSAAVSAVAVVALSIVALSALVAWLEKK
jgi:hypothetical protein